MSINSAVSQVVSQAAGGFVIGATVDKFFPSSGQAGLVQGLEIAGQLVVDFILGQSYWEFVRRRGFASGGGDPLQGASFLIPFLASQPKLGRKIASFNSYLQSLLGNIHFDSNSNSSMMPTNAPSSVPRSTPDSLPSYRDESPDMPKDLDQANAPTDFSAVFAAADDVVADDSFAQMQS